MPATQYPRCAAGRADAYASTGCKPDQGQSAPEKQMRPVPVDYDAVMKIAAISDIHGNLAALDAVLADIRLFHPTAQLQYPRARHPTV